MLREDFRGSWPDRFTYEYVKQQYDDAVKNGKVATFNQELMLRIMSEEDRLIQDGDIGWYKIDAVLRNKGRFNFYITTDFATSERQKADYSGDQRLGLQQRGRLALGRRHLQAPADGQEHRRPVPPRAAVQAARAWASRSTASRRPSSRGSRRR
jgi:hypothetical protein